MAQQGYSCFLTAHQQQVCELTAQIARNYRNSLLSDRAYAGRFKCEPLNAEQKGKIRQEYNALLDFVKAEQADWNEHGFPVSAHRLLEIVVKSPKRFNKADADDLQFFANRLKTHLIARGWNLW